MKILLINNHTRHLDSLGKAMMGHDVEVQLYKPGLDFHEEGKDLVILSGGGGEGLEIHDFYKRGKLWYEDQMEFVRRTNMPIIGICMGFEVIASSYGAQIREMTELIQGHKSVKATKKGRSILAADGLTQFESHFWQVTDVSQKGFEVLAESETGIEIIRHRHKPIFATQFHPEIPGGTLHLRNLLAA